jgi:ABC-type lipoprotein export system ATPase subunit
MNTIKLENISKYYNQTIILDKISYTFKNGYSYLIQGKSGSGKSTLISMISNIIPSNEGQILFNNIDIKNIKIDNYLYSYISIVFQKSHLIDELNVLENVIIKAINNFNRYDEIKTKGLDILNKLNLKNKAYNNISILSGGEQQRLSIARALIVKPKFILIDEPTSSLDSQTANNLIELLIDIVKSEKIGLIITSHDTSIIDYFDKLLYIENKQLVER